MVDLSDHVWERTRSRLDGLRDEEYFWEPAPGSWTIRQRDDGTWMADWPLPRPDPEPFTTVAWRLWRWQHAPVADDPRVERVIRGDPSVLDAFGDQVPTSDLVDHAASYGRWDLVVGLVQRGAPVSATGRTPLHLAAGAGELAVVKTLLDHGADPTVTDPEFHATPLQWAEFLGHPNVAEYLMDRA